MSKRALSQDKNKNTLTQYFTPKSTQNKKKQQWSMNSQSRTGVSNGKRKIIKSKFSKEEEVKKYKVNNLLLKEQLTQKLIQKSKPLVDLLQEIQKSIGQTQYHLLAKFLRNERFRPWVEKYMPKALNQMVSNPSTNRILKWIKANTSYKNNIDMQGDSFINDNSLSMRDEQLKTVLFQQKWQLKALIILGRQGSGKHTILKCLSNTYNIRTYQCSNEINRFNYCKEHYQSIKSHCFKKQDKKPEKQNQNKIKNYFKVSQQLCNKLHIIHQINQVYPDDKRPKFHESVGNFIKQSQVPVIITCSDYKIPQIAGFPQFDVIEIEQLSINAIAKHIWTIVHIQFLLGDLFKNQMIQEEQLQQVFFKYFQKTKFYQILSLEQITIIIQKIGLRIDKILTFFQQYFLDNYPKKYIEFQDIIETIDRQNKYQLSSQSSCSLSLYNMSRFINYKTIVIADKSPLDSLSQSIIDDLLSTAERESSAIKNSFQGYQDSELRNMVSMKRHHNIMKQISSKISHKIGAKFKSQQIMYIKLLEQRKERRLRSNKKAPQTLSISDVLKDYISAQETLYILNTIG